MRAYAEQGSGPHDGEKCDCRTDGAHWRAMCATAQSAYDATHTAAMLDYRRTVRSQPGLVESKVSPWD